MTLANAGNAYTGNTTLDDSRLQITTDTSLPDTTTVYITGTGIIELNNPGTNIVAGLFLEGVEQEPGIYNASSNPTWFLGTGSLSVIPEPGTMSLLGLVGLGLMARRRRRTG
ncbi:MAG: PEP-CTERM sorting domain-containing protein [Verrucomicrobia bacterium]|nr:PEP-CTERM sorting domain-containing protein [Verrucomicrobiota bacterium]